MKSLEECVVLSVDGSDKGLYPFLPYILQDVWEIGSDPGVIAELIAGCFKKRRRPNVLDLGCGKGAVSIEIAKRLRCTCYGIDAIPEFIRIANEKADEFGVKDLCTFEIGDMREAVPTLPVFDVIILGSIGPVFGNYRATLSALKKNLGPDGILIIDDGYIEDNRDYEHPSIMKRRDILDQIRASGMRVISERIMNRDEIKKSDELIFGKLKRRCLELIEKHPDKRTLFEDYLVKQVEENDVLENRVVCATMVVRMK